MNRMIKLIFTLPLIISTLFSSILVVNSVDQKEHDLAVLDSNKGLYISANGLSTILTSREPFVNIDRMKMVLYFSDTRIKISSNSSFILVDEDVFHMPIHSIDNGKDIYLPAVPFFNILKQTVLPGLTYDPIKQRLDIDVIEFNPVIPFSKNKIN